MTYYVWIWLSHTDSQTQADAATDVRQMYSSECGKKRTVWKPPTIRAKSGLKCYTDKTKYMGTPNGANGLREAIYLVWFPHISLSSLLPLHLCHFLIHSFCRTVFLSINIYHHHLPTHTHIYTHWQTYTHRRPVPTVAGAAERRVNLRTASPLFTCKKEVAQGFCYFEVPPSSHLKTTGIYPQFMI